MMVDIACMPSEPGCVLFFYMLRVCCCLGFGGLVHLWKIQRSYHGVRAACLSRLRQNACMEFSCRICSLARNSTHSTVPHHGLRWTQIHGSWGIVRLCSKFPVHTVHVSAPLRQNADVKLYVSANKLQEIVKRCCRSRDRLWRYLLPIWCCTPINLNGAFPVFAVTHIRRYTCLRYHFIPPKLLDSSTRGRCCRVFRMLRC